ncbi:MAG: hypothetical protein AAB625_00320 [Patescibacteria group bacterium]
MPDGTMMTPENSYNQFKIGESTQSIGGEMSLTPQFGAKADLPKSKTPDIDQDKIGPDEGHQMRVGGEIKNQGDSAEELAAQVAEQVARHLMDEREGSSSAFYALTDILNKERIPQKEKLSQLSRERLHF